MNLLPDDDQARKALPIFKMICRYFPKALREVTRVCVANNVRYSPERAPEDIRWARGKSTDQLGSAFRHMLESAVDGKVFEKCTVDVRGTTGNDEVYVLAQAAWRLLAALELQIEAHDAQHAQCSLGEEPKHFNELNAMRVAERLEAAEARLGAEANEVVSSYGGTNI